MSDASDHGVLTCSMACFWLDLVVDVEENPLPIIERYVDMFPQEPQIALKFLAAKAEVTGRFFMGWLNFDFKFSNSLFISRAFILSHFTYLLVYLSLF